MINADGWTEEHIELYMELEAKGLLSDGKLTEAGRTLLDAHFFWVNGMLVPRENAA